MLLGNSNLQNARANCRDIFHFCEMPAQIAEAFFTFAKCQRKLQKHFSFLQNAIANCRSIFHFCEMPAQIAEAFPKLYPPLKKTSDIYQKLGKVLPNQGGSINSINH